MSTSYMSHSAFTLSFPSQCSYSGVHVNVLNQRYPSELSFGCHIHRPPSCTLHMPRSTVTFGVRIQISHSVLSSSVPIQRSHQACSFRCYIKFRVHNQRSHSAVSYDVNVQISHCQVMVPFMCQYVPFHMYVQIAHYTLPANGSHSDFSIQLYVIFRLHIYPSTRLPTFRVYRYICEMSFIQHLN